MNMTQRFAAFALSSGAALVLCVGLPNVLVHSAHARVPGKPAVMAAGEPRFVVCPGRPTWDWPLPPPQLRHIACRMPIKLQNRSA